MEWPEKPQERIHLDHADPFLCHMFLIRIDAHLKWMDDCPLPSASSTIDCLQKIFSSQGLLEIIVSDNVASFVSSEIKDFMNKNAIKHVTCAPTNASKGQEMEIQLGRFTHRYIYKH